MTVYKPSRAYPTAQADLEAAEKSEASPQTQSSSYRLAFADPDFLLQDELRPVRLQLELLKTELLLTKHNIESTVVVFGSARIPSPAIAAGQLKSAQQRAQQDPLSKANTLALNIARRVADNSKFHDIARAFSQKVSTAGIADARHDYVIMTGGGGGIMEAANQGAHDAGAKSIGLNIVLPTEQAPNPYITPELCMHFHYFALRKMHFLMRARALAIFPGGFGTLDELFDALTLIQTGKMRPIPVLLFGQEYWQRIINFDAMVEEGTISPEDLDIINYVESAQDGCDHITSFYDNQGSAAK